MALQTSGAISASDINVELGESSTHQFSMNNAEERGLAEKASGTISFSDFYGKSNVQVLDFRFEIGAYAENLGSDYTRRVGVSDLADADWRFGTFIDRRGTMEDKNGVKHTMELYYFAPEYFSVAGPTLPGGEPGIDTNSWQASRFSIFRSDGGSTAGSEFDFTSAVVQIFRESDGALLFSTLRANPANGTGNASSYINMTLQGSSESTSSISYLAYKAMSDNVGQTVRMEITWNA